jgi:adenylate cyclase
MACKLVWRRGSGRQEWPLEGTVLKLGRDPANDIVIDSGDLSVSRFHARLEGDGRHWRIVDTRSRNHVRVNGEFIPAGEAGARLLRDGDTVLLGASVELRFLREEDAGVVLDERPQDPEASVLTRSAALGMDGVSTLIQAPGRLPDEAERALEQARQALRVVTEVGRRIAAVTPADEIVEAIVDLVFEVTPAERAALLLWDHDLQRLVPKLSRTRASHQAALMTISSSLVQQACDEGAVVQMDPRAGLTDSMLLQGLRSAVAVPLRGESRAVGVIYADTSQLHKAFDPFAVALLSALASHTAAALEQQRALRLAREEERKRQRLEQYLARSVVNRILASGVSSSGLTMRAEEAEVTVLFCDMAGFTARTEDMAPREVLALLNRCFSHMTEVIHEHEGTLDKYIGDCIMAVFGAPEPQPDHARRAALAALGLREAVRRINAAGAGVEVDFRIGLHSGRVIAGDVGHVARRDWTVLGSTVNIASRMESAVARPGQIVLTAETRAGLGPEFELAPVAVVKPPKGITRDFQAFELLGRREGPDGPRS